MAGIDPRALLTPKERLALSRRALVRELNGGREPEREPRTPQQERARRDAEAAFAQSDPDDAGAAFEGQRAHDAGDGRGGNARVWASVARSMAERWWRRHPAHAAGQLARPLLERYARKEPAKLMAIAAATGAVVVLVRPWRLLSVTAVLAAVLKTSDLADIVNTLMQQKTTPPRKDPP
ncbi:hypothetical protein [Variovorax sp.]|uniref:hypothetical protein n=1 Tax=Variovorax sp. TaxID=1871043 RepID=UPI001383531E|nr:hypothetical protein [Variovorax sp.]KAF1057449.1 MAG: hypothetical protein GAK39_06168 [Variovorax sp.]